MLRNNTAFCLACAQPTSHVPWYLASPARSDNSRACVRLQQGGPRRARPHGSLRGAASANRAAAVARGSSGGGRRGGGSGGGGKRSRKPAANRDTDDDTDSDLDE